MAASGGSTSSSSASAQNDPKLQGEPKQNDSNQKKPTEEDCPPTWTWSPSFELDADEVFEDRGIVYTILPDPKRQKLQ